MKRDFLLHRVEARRQHDLAALAQRAHVGAVLVHDGEPLGALVLRAGLVDEHDLGVEIALLERQLLVDLVGGDVGEAPPRRVGEPLAVDVRDSAPRPTAGTRPGRGRPRPWPTCPTTSASAPAAAQSRVRGVWLTLVKRSGNACGVEQLEQAGAFEVGGDHAARRRGRAADWPR